MPRMKRKVIMCKRSKKRGLRGGEINTAARVDSEGLHGITGRYSFTRGMDLTPEVCGEWFGNIKGLDNATRTTAFDKTTGNLLKGTYVGKRDYADCKKIINDVSLANQEAQEAQTKQEAMQEAKRTQLEAQLDQAQLDQAQLDQAQLDQAQLDQAQVVQAREFTTTLSTNNTDQTLTLEKCRAEKLHIQNTPYFEYKIYSPARSTLPPNGKDQLKTQVGTFTQLPISYFLTKALDTPTSISFASLYGGNKPNPNKQYINDYLTCINHVKTQFEKIVIASSEEQSPTFRKEGQNVLRDFGKHPDCSIVLLASNVGIEIQKPENDGAVFVLPSQFNGAEYMSPSNGHQTQLTTYKMDLTAGPLGQLSCHPVVAKFILDHAARTGFTSDPFLVINAIDNVILELNATDVTSLTLTNGYLEVPEKLRDKPDSNFNLMEIDLNPQIVYIFDSFCQRLKVLQTDDVPTSGLKPPPKSHSDPNGYVQFNSDATSKVTLIYASAVPLDYMSRINKEKSTLQYCVAGFDLVAQYFGAMVSAYCKQKEKNTDEKVKLFLTPLGGGVFHNPREMIASAILLAYHQAKQIITDFDNRVAVIFLIWDGNPAEINDFTKFFNLAPAGTPRAPETNANGGNKSRRRHRPKTCRRIMRTRNKKYNRKR